MTLLPDRLIESWEEVTAGRLTQEDFSRQHERLLADYQSTWRRALLREGETDLRTSLLCEVAAYYDISDLAEVERRCNDAVLTLQREWEEKVNPVTDPA